MKKPYSFIFHIDFDSFFVSALRTIYPELNNKPVAIAKSSVHAVAESISYELRKLGFKAGQKIYEIKKLEPKTIVVESRYDVYNTISTEIFNYLKTKYSSNLEIASIDECYIFFNYKTLQSEQQALDLAKQIQSQVLKKFKIPISIGISTTKFYAKMTTNISKPFGIGLTNKDNYKERFFDLDIIKFHGIGDKLAQKLNKIGIYKIKDFYNFDLSNFLLKSVLGTTAYKYYDALNIDFQDKINQEDQLKGIGNEVSFANASNDENLIYNALDEMVKKVASRLKHYEKVGNNISLVIRMPTKNWVSKNMQLDYNLSSYQDIKKHAYYLYQQHFADKEILGIGVRISGLLESYNNYQKISLFDKNSKKLSQVDMIISKLKHKTNTNKIYTLSDYQKVKNRKNRFGNDPLGSVIFKK